VAGWAEDTQVQYVARDTDEREAIVRCADVDPLNTCRHVEGNIGTLVDPETEPALEGQGRAGGFQGRHDVVSSSASGTSSAAHTQPAVT
jgi:hypothetical protein